MQLRSQVSRSTSVKGVHRDSDVILRPYTEQIEQQTAEDTVPCTYGDRLEATFDFNMQTCQGV